MAEINKRKAAPKVPDRIDIHCEIQAVPFSELSKMKPGEPSTSHRERVIKARLIQEERFKDYKNVHCNAQDGNGRVGRLLMFKECLANHHVPFIITDELKMFYYRGLREWGNTNGYLTDTCLTAQDSYKALLDYFKIRY